jgi:hypothetical protein
VGWSVKGRRFDQVDQQSCRSTCRRIRDPDHAAVSTFDQTRNIRHDERQSINLHTAQVRVSS